MRIVSEGRLWANPAPLLVSRQAVFAGVTRCEGGDLVALFSIGQAFDAADMRAHVSRSADGGHVWTDPVPMHGADHRESETFKPLALHGGGMIALGYGFVRPDALTPIVDPVTHDLLPLRNRVAFSADGRDWTVPQILDLGAGLELSGPPIQLASGRILAVAAPFHLAPKGQEGWVIASDDNGHSWRRLSLFHQGGSVAAWEARLADLGQGRIAVLFWAHDLATGQNLTNRIALSQDGGATFGDPIDTGIAGQASNLIALGPDRILSIHSQRQAPVSLSVYDITLSPRFTAERRLDLITGGTGVSGDAAAQFAALRFGQPALLRLSGTGILATAWAVEACQHVIRRWHLDLT